MESKTPGLEANRLYWQTERSVADIAGTLGVSRRVLYELIQPESTGVSCGACGSEVVFVNRSARASGSGRCPQCGAECEIESDADEAQDTIPPYAPGWPSAAEVSADEFRERALKIGGAAVAGVLLGALAALLVTRRR